jgi:coproporphyrinogen III oxidase-like Fe-S oxidoreductase
MKKEDGFGFGQRNQMQTEFENDIIETIYFGGGTPSV